MTEAEKIAITKYDLYYESRMTKVESAMESLTYEVKEIRKEMKSDFRWILGMMLALLTLMAHGFKWF